MPLPQYVPHVIEPSTGVDRLFLALLTSAYCEDEVGGEKRTVLKFHPSMAPIKVRAWRGLEPSFLLRRPSKVERAPVFKKMWSGGEGTGWWGGGGFSR